jgi:UDP:flavonoid glycosyltransferase YjiC (YdhE family)
MDPSVEKRATVEGATRDPGDLGTPPANVHDERWLPQADILRYASAIVCHGGSGTVRGTLAEGVPLVIVPMFADQPDNAARVHELGAGLAVESAYAGIDGLARAVGTLLSDDRYAAGAANVAGDIRALPTVDAAVEILRELASTRSTTPATATSQRANEPSTPR